MSTSPSVQRHYQPEDPAALIARVRQYLADLPEEVTGSQLAGLDQFHVRGLAATADLAAKAGIQADWEVLDAGSGLGGPSRYLAETFGCRVVGVDLMPSFVEVAQLLAKRTNLADRVTYMVGDLTDLPFDQGRFDAVWTQHVVMNIPERQRLYGEIRRVLKPGGVFAFYDPVAADDHPAIDFPVPWAESADSSFLLTAAETALQLGQAGLTPVAVDDVTAEAVAWFAKQQARPPAPQSVNLAAVMGRRFPGMTANLARCLADGRLRLLMGVCTAI